MSNIVRANTLWYRINPKPYEPERQTNEIIWSLIKNPCLTQEQIYKNYFEKQRFLVKVLYPTFRKDGEL